MKQRPELKQREKRPFRWRRFVLVSGIILVLLLGAAWYAYERMTDKLLEVLMDETLQSNETMEAGITNDEAEGATGLNSEKKQEIKSPSSNVPTADSSKTSEPTTPKHQEKGNNSTSATKEQASKPPKSGAITVKQAASTADKVTIKDKLKVGSVLLNHWSSDELKSFKQALSGGLTIEEKRKRQTQYTCP